MVLDLGLRVECLVDPYLEAHRPAMGYLQPIVKGGINYGISPSLSPKP